jgi:hypothetical protein
MIKSSVVILHRLERLIIEWNPCETPYNELSDILVNLYPFIPSCHDVSIYTGFDEVFAVSLPIPPSFSSLILASPEKLKAKASSCNGLCSTYVNDGKQSSFVRCTHCNRYFHNNNHCSSSQDIIRPCSDTTGCKDESDEWIADCGCRHCGSMVCTICMAECDTCRIALCHKPGCNTSCPSKRCGSEGCQWLSPLPTRRGIHLSASAELFSLRFRNYYFSSFTVSISYDICSRKASINGVTNITF